MHTLTYKGWFIHLTRNELARKWYEKSDGGETVTYQCPTTLKVFQAKSLHSAKIKISRLLTKVHLTNTKNMVLSNS